MNKKLKLLTLSLTTISMLNCSTIVNAWDSREDATVMDTHKMIAVQALKLIENDMKADTKVNANLELLKKNILSYQKGAIAPDFGVVGVDRDYELYQDHFYDPDSGDNFTANITYPFYKVPDTAESQIRNYFSQALATWKDGDYAQASYLLGKAIHYFGDINQPHHALNWTGGPGTAHTNFEGYIESVKDKFKINTIGNDKSEYTLNNDKPILEFLTIQANKYARLSKSLAPKVSMKNSYTEWEDAASISLSNAQKGMAVMVYRFLEEVSKNTTSVVNNKIGKFHVVLTTDSEKDSGTDDYVYFGINFKNGKNVEFECNLPGNDFKTGTTGSYQFDIEDPNLIVSDIEKVYIRKQKYMGDDLKLKKALVYIGGQRVVNNDVNSWLKGNVTYNIDLNKAK
ncbi:phospholipase C / alpha-toxin [Clostridium cavendishii DSM 21758]|uniref:Phospholipase C n=1 Tax=Clostridium cavendishii DSM 21758 TaxID=1121302 RepID=A0A1M6J8V2_9CLOT|nr:phospholipase C [Clostridium cavendishii]SHJ43070.1 phospholipase C / alpha-toxin [Clostridium cavendishii DSM 21758]